MCQVQHVRAGARGRLPRDRLRVWRGQAAALPPVPSLRPQPKCLARVRGRPPVRHRDPAPDPAQAGALPAPAPPVPAAAVPRPRQPPRRVRHRGRGQVHGPVH